MSDNSTLYFSPAIGLTQQSNAALLRFGYAYELRGFGTRIAQMFGGKH
jgi:hypothetical protein